jgi:hypothetical protein
LIYADIPYFLYVKAEIHEKYLSREPILHSSGHRRIIGRLGLGPAASVQNKQNVVEKWPELNVILQRQVMPVAR